jgi:hypothetical protein
MYVPFVHFLLKNYPTELDGVFTNSCSVSLTQILLNKPFTILGGGWVVTKKMTSCTKEWEQRYLDETS